jgi:hypothetical protein
VHGLSHPLPSHVEKLFPQLLVLGQSSKPHALACVTYAFLIDGGHDALQFASRRGWKLLMRDDLA